MTEHYPETPAGDNAPASALRLAGDIAASIRGGLKPADTDKIRALFGAMIDTAGTTPADAMPLTFWTQSLLYEVANRMQTEADATPLRDLVLICAMLSERATVTLETATGIPAARFSGEAHLAN